MKAMKIKMVLAIAIVAIFASTSVATSQCPLDDDQEPNLKVEVKIVRVFQRWYLIRTTVKNLEDEQVILGVARPPGGFMVYNDYWEKICSRPRYITMIIEGLVLEPNQEEIIFIGIWNMRWYMSWSFHIRGYMRSYEYQGTRYPAVLSEPVTISRIKL